MNMIHRTASSTAFWCCTLITILFIDQTNSELEKPDPRGVRINKCCEAFEILIDSRCTQVNDTTTGKSSSIYIPQFCSDRVRRFVHAIWVTLKSKWMNGGCQLFYLFINVLYLFQADGHPCSPITMATVMCKCRISILPLVCQNAAACKCGPFIIIQR